MRTTILSICIVASATAIAQDNGFISGTFSMNSQKLDREGSAFDEKYMTGTFGPAVGFNLSPKHVVGLALGLTGSTHEYKANEFTANPLDVTETKNLTTITPFYRYMKSVNEKFLLYGQAKVGFGFGKEVTEVESTPSDTETKLSTLDARVGPGIVYVVADRWALSADWGILGFSSEKETTETATEDVTSTVSGFQATLSPGAITFALNWLF
jgi:hypothetical protein